MRIIFVHVNPDIDAIGGAWIIKTFLPEWKNAEVKFVPPGKETEAKVDKNPDEFYIDVGLGMLDHHQAPNDSSATEKCFKYVLEKRKNMPFSELDRKALGEIVDVVNQIDNARDLTWPEISSPRSDFYLYKIIEATRWVTNDDNLVTDLGFKSLDAVFLISKKRINAVEELAKGTKFKTSKGEGIGIETGNDEVLIEGEKMGYAIVVRKDDKGGGGVRIYCRWDNKVDLTASHDEVRKQDPGSDWYLHSSKKLLLNQSTMTKMRPTKLSLEEIIEILKEKV